MAAANNMGVANAQKFLQTEVADLSTSEKNSVVELLQAQLQKLSPEKKEEFLNIVKTTKFTGDKKTDTETVNTLLTAFLLKTVEGETTNAGTSQIGSGRRQRGGIIPEVLSYAQSLLSSSGAVVENAMKGALEAVKTPYGVAAYLAGLTALAAGQWYFDPVRYDKAEKAAVKAERERLKPILAPIFGMIDNKISQLTAETARLTTETETLKGDLAWRGEEIESLQEKLQPYFATLNAVKRGGRRSTYRQRRNKNRTRQRA